MTKKFDYIPLADKIFSVLVILLPFLYQYKGIGESLSLGELLLFPVMFYLFVRNFSFSLKKVDTWLLTFYAATIFAVIMNVSFSYFSFSTASTVLLRLFYYAIVIWIAKEHFYLEYVKNLYYFAVFAFSLYLIIQYIFHYSTGGYLPIYLKFEWQLPAEARVRDLDIMYRWDFRPSSLFLEPSYYSLFTLPSVILLLYERVSTNIKTIIFITVIVGLVLSGAGSAIVGLIVIFTVFLFRKAENKKASLLFRLLIVIAALGVAILYFIYSENATDAANRILSGGSFDQRITRSLIVFKELPIYHKIFGVGLNNLEPFMLYNHMSTQFDEHSLDYGCALFQTLNFSGIIGFVSLVSYLVHLKSKINWRMKYSPIEESSFSRSGVIPMFWLITFTISYEAILFSYRFTFLLVILHALSSPKQTNKKEVENFENSLHRYSVRRSPHNLSF